MYTNKILVMQVIFEQSFIKEHFQGRFCLSNSTSKDSSCVHINIVEIDNLHIRRLEEAQTE